MYRPNLQRHIRCLIETMELEVGELLLHLDTDTLWFLEYQWVGIDISERFISELQSLECRFGFGLESDSKVLELKTSEFRCSV